MGQHGTHHLGPNKRVHLSEDVPVEYREVIHREGLVVDLLIILTRTLRLCCLFSSLNPARRQTLKDDFHQTQHIDNNFPSTSKNHNPRNNSPTGTNTSPKHRKIKQNGHPTLANHKKTNNPANSASSNRIYIHKCRLLRSPQPTSKRQPHSYLV